MELGNTTLSKIAALITKQLKNFVRKKLVYPHSISIPLPGTGSSRSPSSPTRLRDKKKRAKMPSKPGTLRITVIKAHLNNIHEDARSANPVCSVSVGSLREKTRVTPEWTGSDPIWDETFFFEIGKLDITTPIELDLSYKANNKHGAHVVTSIPLHSLQKNLIHTETFSLRDKKTDQVTGTIELEYLLVQDVIDKELLLGDYSSVDSASIHTNFEAGASGGTGTSLGLRRSLSANNLSLSHSSMKARRHVLLNKEAGLDVSVDGLKRTNTMASRKTTARTQIENLELGIINTLVDKANEELASLQQYLAQTVDPSPNVAEQVRSARAKLIALEQERDEVRAKLGLPPLQPATPLALFDSGSVSALHEIPTLRTGTAADLSSRSDSMLSLPHDVSTTSLLSPGSVADRLSLHCYLELLEGVLKLNTDSLVFEFEYNKIPGIFIEGYLNTRKQDKMIWSKRYFTLTRSRMSYYKEAKSFYFPSGVIALKDIISIEKVYKEKDDQLTGFKITTSAKKARFFTVRDPNIAANWIQQIQTALLISRGSGSSNSSTTQQFWFPFECLRTVKASGRDQVVLNLANSFGAEDAWRVRGVPDSQELVSTIESLRRKYTEETGIKDLQSLVKPPEVPATKFQELFKLFVSDDNVQGFFRLMNSLVCFTHSWFPEFECGLITANKKFGSGALFIADAYLCFFNSSLGRKTKVLS